MRQENDTTTTDGERFDAKTGEVLGVAPVRRSWGRPKHTPEEEAEAARVRDARAADRRALVTVLRETDPACETDDDPPVVWRTPARIGGEPPGRVFDRERLSGRGMPGSRLVAVARYYDGCGPNGGEAHYAVTAHVVFRDRAGHLRRTVGVQIHRAELRDFAAALVAHADALDGKALA